MSTVPSYATKWVPFELACRWRCLQRGTLNIGNTQQNRLNLQSLAVTQANSVASTGVLSTSWAKWHLGNVNNTNPAQSLLIMAVNVPGVQWPPDV